MKIITETKLSYYTDEQEKREEMRTYHQTLWMLKSAH